MIVSGAAWCGERSCGTQPQQRSGADLHFPGTFPERIQQFSMANDRKMTGWILAVLIFLKDGSTLLGSLSTDLKGRDQCSDCTGY